MRSAILEKTDEFEKRATNQDDPTFNDFAIPFELVTLADAGCAGCARATNRGTTDSADDAIVGWQKLSRLSYRTATVDSAPDHDSTEHGFALASSPRDQRCYVLSGHRTVEKRETGERTIVHAGQTVAETVQTTHRGFTTDEPVELVVFYAGRVGVPITINEE